jgi:glycosyltransferase involved in cell wall biosynthesis
VKVSIVTPSFNQAEFIERTIQSVLAQDYPEIEYLIVDGGSTDGSAAIIEKYAARLAWWVSEPDGGQGEAINKGFARAAGDLFAWLNSDDVLTPGAVRAAVETFRAHPEAALVYGDALSVDAADRPLNEMRFQPWGADELATFHIICQPAVFFRREAWERAGGLDTGYHLLLDHHLWLRVASTRRLVHVPEIWAHARQHPAAKNVALAEKFGEEAFRLVEWMRTDPALAPIVARQPRKVRAAALRFSARYLLDAGKARPALISYLQSLISHPPTALVEWHRILFAALSLIGLGGLGKLYYRLKHRRRSNV